MRRWSGRQVAFDRRNRFSSEKLSELIVCMPREIAAQIFTHLARSAVSAQKPLDRIRDILRRATISNRTRDRLCRTHRSAQADVVGIDEHAIYFDFLAL